MSGGAVRAAWIATARCAGLAMTGCLRAPLASAGPARHRVEEEQADVDRGDEPWLAGFVGDVVSAGAVRAAWIATARCAGLAMTGCLRAPLASAGPARHRVDARPAARASRDDGGRLRGASGRARRSGRRGTPLGDRHGPLRGPRDDGCLRAPLASAGPARLDRPRLSLGAGTARCAGLAMTGVFVRLWRPLGRHAWIAPGFRSGQARPGALAMAAGRRWAESRRRDIMESRVRRQRRSRGPGRCGSADPARRS